MNPGKSFLRHGKSKSLANEVLRGKARQDVTKIFTIKRERKESNNSQSYCSEKQGSREGNSVTRFGLNFAALAKFKKYWALFVRVVYYLANFCLYFCNF